jgi:hypothetical protein
MFDHSIGEVIYVNDVELAAVAPICVPNQLDAVGKRLIEPLLLIVIAYIVAYENAVIALLRKEGHQPRVDRESVPRLLHIQRIEDQRDFAFVGFGTRAVLRSLYRMPLLDRAVSV